VTTFWLVLAGCCIAAAAVLIARGNFDMAFVVAVVGMVSWFLNYRTQIQRSIAAEDATSEAETETERDEDQDQ